MSDHELPPGEDDEDPLYTDEHGVPMLFDVVIPGDYLKAAGFVLAPPEAAAPVQPSQPPAPPPPSAEEIEARIQAAIAAALPVATERAAAAIREALLAEVQQALTDTPRSPQHD